MLGNIEDLERDIEQFRSNVAASNEMYTLLNQILEQIRQQNTTFDNKSEDLLGRLDGIPASLDTANAASNAAVKKDISVEIDRAVSDFTAEQTKYLQVLELMQKKVHAYNEQSQKQAESFDKKTAEIIEEVSNVSKQIKDNTISSLEEFRSSLDDDTERRNAQLEKTQQQYVTAISAEIDRAICDFTAEQTKYLQALELMQKKVHAYDEQLQKQAKSFDEKTAEIIEEVSNASDQIKDNTISSLEEFRSALDIDTEKRNAQLEQTHQQYVSVISAEIDRAINGFTAEQAKYLHVLELMQKEVHTYIEQSQKQAESFDEKTAELIEEVANVPIQIKDNTISSLEEFRSALDIDVEKRNAQLEQTQQQYVSAMEKTSVKFKSFEDQLLSKYQEFLETLEKTNLSNLYEQNQKLQTELNKRTTILVIISAISVVLGVIGLIL